MTDEDQKYREIREQGRQDGIADGRKGYVLVESGRAHREPELGERCSEGMLITEHTRVAQPPLPTEPYTVIRVTWRHRDYQSVFVLDQDGGWEGLNGESYGPERLAKLTTGFEVLATSRDAQFLQDQVMQERRVTAKAMHRDEAIYARADAHAITLTAEEAQLVAWALRHVKGWPRGLDWDAMIAHSHRREALAARLEAAS